MSEIDSIGRRHADLTRLSFDDAEPPPLESLTSSRQEPQRRAVLAVMVGAAAVMAALLPVLLLSDSRHPAVTTVPVPSSDTLPERARFVPPSYPDGDTVVFPLILLDGSRISLTLPPSLGNSVTGFIPGGAAGWEADPCCSRTLTVLYGSIGDVVGDRLPDEVLEDAAGRPVHYYEDLDFEGRSDLSYLVFQYGSWVVMVWDGGSGGAFLGDGGRVRFASLMDGYETPEGFLVLDPVEPMEVMPTDAPDAHLTTEDRAVGVIRRDCSAEAARSTAVNTHGYTIRVISESGLTVLCAPDQSMLVSVGRTDLTVRELDAIRLITSAVPTSSFTLPQPIGLELVAVDFHERSVAVVDFMTGTVHQYERGEYQAPHDTIDGASGGGGYIHLWADGTVYSYWPLTSPPIVYQPSRLRRPFQAAPTLTVVPAVDGQYVWLVQGGFAEEPTLLELVNLFDGEVVRIMSTELAGTWHPMGATSEGLVMISHEPVPLTRLVGVDGDVIAEEPGLAVSVGSTGTLIHRPDGSLVMTSASLGLGSVVEAEADRWFSVGGPMAPTISPPVRTGNQRFLVGRAIAPMMGDEELVLVDADSVTGIYQFGRVARMVSWSRDEAWIVVVEGRSVTLISAEGGDILPLGDLIPDSHHVLTAG